MTNVAIEVLVTKMEENLAEMRAIHQKQAWHEEQLGQVHGLLEVYEGIHKEYYEALEKLDPNWWDTEGEE